MQHHARRAGVELVTHPLGAVRGRPHRVGRGQPLLGVEVPELAQLVGRELRGVGDAALEQRVGTDPVEIVQSMRDDFAGQPEWAAAAKDWAKSTCPDQLANNEVLRNIISNTGGDPDS